MALLINIQVNGQCGMQVYGQCGMAPLINMQVYGQCGMAPLVNMQVWTVWDSSFMQASAPDFILDLEKLYVLGF